MRPGPVPRGPWQPGLRAGDVNGGDAKVAVAPDGEVRHQGPCSMTAFPWDFEKPGGQGH